MTVNVLFRFIYNSQFASFVLHCLIFDIATIAVGVLDGAFYLEQLQFFCLYFI